MKNIISFIVLIVLIIGVGAYLFTRSNVPPKDVDTTSTYNPQIQGKVIFGITDAIENMGNISAVVVTINKVEVHSATNNWVTVLNETKQYDLVALKQSGVVSLLASANLDAGTYDQVRLMISKVLVTNAGVQTEAKLPSGELKIIGDIVINTDKTSSIVFDFLADKSLHITGNGKIIFSPVIKVKKQDDVKVELKSNSEINITGGEQGNDQDVGMDEKGEMKSNFELRGNLNIDLQGNIQIGGDDQGKLKNNEDLEFNFSAQNNSGLSGTATLSENNGKTKVELKLKNSILGGIFSSAQPAHIHFGSCANIGGIKYSLNSVVNGKSETTLNVSLAEIKAGFPLSINVHKSAVEISVYVACTDLSF